MLYRIQLFTLLCYCSLNLFSQNIELVGGFSRNTFYDLDMSGTPHTNSSYTPGFGYIARIGIEEVKLGKMDLRFTISYDYYKGGFNFRNSGLGGENSKEGVINKSVLSLGFYPLNFQINNRLDLNFGLESGLRIHEKVDGTSKYYTIDSPNQSTNLEDSNIKYSTPYTFAFSYRVAYDFYIGDSFIITPQYLFQFGFLGEFDNDIVTTRAIRHYFCIGISRKLGK